MVNPLRIKSVLQAQPQKVQINTGATLNSYTRFNWRKASVFILVVKARAVIGTSKEPFEDILVTKQELCAAVLNAD